MEDEEGFLKITNYRTHPTSKGHKVFFFREAEHADYFETLIRERNVSFERDVDANEKGTLHLFGIKRDQMQVALEVNRLVYAKFRQPFISNKPLRIAALIIALFALGLGIAGYLISE